MLTTIDISKTKPNWSDLLLQVREHGVNFLLIDGTQEVAELSVPQQKSSLDMIPERFRPHLSPLSTLNDAQLWSIVKRDLSDEDTNRYDSLLKSNTNGTLTLTERTQLTQLREKADLLMFGRSYALLLLKQRGTATTLSFGRRHDHHCCAGEWVDSAGE